MTYNVCFQLFSRKVKVQQRHKSDGSIEFHTHQTLNASHTEGGGDEASVCISHIWISTAITLLFSEILRQDLPPRLCPL